MFRRPRTPVRHLVVGLGNPGPEYAGTRHNVGFMVVDRLSQRHGIALKTTRHGARVGDGMIAGEPVALVKPLTFMNLSGRAVAPLANRHSLLPGHLIVIYDDADLPVGKIRLRARGSAGGHGGLKSIIAALGSAEFPRVRIGIGRSSGSDLINLMHEGAVSTLEVPCIIGEDMYDALIKAQQRLAGAVGGGSQTDIGNAIFDMEALIVTNCLFTEVLDPLTFFPGPTQTFTDPITGVVTHVAAITEPGNLSQSVPPGAPIAIAGIIDTTEHPCCCKLLVDLEWISIKNGLIGQTPTLPTF